MIDLTVFFIYRTIVAPLLVFLLNILRPILKGKLREVVIQRANPQSPTMSARPILVHASSGEVEYAKPVIRELKTRFPQVPILLTYFSPSALRLVSDLDMVDMIWPLPFDARAPMSRFLTKINPRLVLFARTDVWPEMTFQCKKRGIPSYLFSATLAENSSRLKFPAFFLTRLALDRLSGIFCVSGEDRAGFLKLGVRTTLEVTGDSRFDQAQFRLEHPKPTKKVFSRHGSQKIFVIGSSWAADELVLLQSLRDLSPELWQSIKIIWAPHEIDPSHLTELRQQWSDRSWQFVNYSQIRDAGEWRQILLIDQVGILADLYRFGDFAFVGGSFKDRVHSVMEPLLAGLNVAVGPFYQNNREALQFRGVSISPESPALVTVCQNAHDLTHFIATHVQNSQDPASIRSKVQESAGASQIIVQKIAQKIQVDLGG